MPDAKFWLKSKTIIFNLVVLVLAVLAGLGFNEFIPGEQVQETSALLTTLVVAAVPVVNLILRAVTDTPITLSK